MAASYIKALENLRNQVMNANPVEQAMDSLAPVSPRGFMPAIKTSNARPPTSSTPQYDPLNFVRGTMSEIQAAQKRFQEKMAKMAEEETKKAPAAAFSQGFVSRRQAIEEEKSLAEAQTASPNALSGPAGGPVPRSGNALSGPAGAPAEEGTLISLIDRTEGGGAYDTLYGYSQQGDGPFAGVDVSQMTIGELKEFSNPSGEYGQWVASRNNGTVATPMGRYQIVGRTLRATADAMGLPDDTVFDAATQDAMAQFLINQALSRSDTLEGKMAALRNEWHGFRSVPDATLAAAIQRTS